MINLNRIKKINCVYNFIEVKHIFIFNTDVTFSIVTFSKSLRNYLIKYDFYISSSSSDTYLIGTGYCFMFHIFSAYSTAALSDDNFSII